MGRIEIKLKEVIDEREITQAKLSEISGVRAATISGMARGNTEMLSLRNTAKIMDALGLRCVSDLLKYEK